MPLFTFACAQCGHTKEVLCSVKERDTLEVDCPLCAEVLDFGRVLMTWRGVESPTLRTDGAYSFKVIGEDGSKERPDVSKTRRTDW